MNPEYSLSAFEERKETIFKWAVEVRGIENSQRIIGDNASKAITELLSAYLHKHRKVEVGFQLNHSWFKSQNVNERLPEFPHKEIIVASMIRLETLCENLSYGAPRPLARVKETLQLFQELEKKIKEIIQ